MHTLFTTSTFKNASLIALLSAGFSLFGATAASADTDFTNPAVALSGQAVIASGTCIAKYAASLDDRTKPAEEIGRLIAKRCSKEISRSAGLASWMVGKPEEFQKNLKYTQDKLTTNAVERSRAAMARPHAA
jgi:hypothetical protein